MQYKDAETAGVLVAETAKVLEEPIFQRSPVLSRLLTYLVSSTLEGRTIKAFEVAVDGLGKPYTPGLDADNYARVAVARLRKALFIYYASEQREDQIDIPLGSYGVRLRRAGEAEPAVDAVEAGQGDSRPRVDPSPFRSLAVWLAILSGVLTALLVAEGHSGTSAKTGGAWTVANFPTVAVGIGPGHPQPVPEYCRQSIIVALGAYTGIRLVEAPSQSPDYELWLEASMRGSAGRPTISLVHRASGRIVWSESYDGDGGCLVDSEVERVSFSIAGPGGSLESFERRNGRTADTPYGCWLRFTQSVNTYRTVGDSALGQCAKNGIPPLQAILPLPCFIVGPLRTTLHSNCAGRSEKRAWRAHSMSFRAVLPFMRGLRRSILPGCARTVSWAIARR